jgi:hypothetical protein
MKNLKILFFALTIIVFLFPIKTFGFFATADEYVHTMPFGVQLNGPIGQKAVTLPVLNQSNNEDFDNNNEASSQNLAQQIKNKNPIIEKYNYFLKNITWIVFFSAIAVVIISFILLKFKKVL